jgi:hypothetical protein
VATAMPGQTFHRDVAERLSEVLEKII